MPAPDQNLAPDARLRAEVATLVRGGNAHAPAAAVLDGIPADRVNERPDGLPYSLWDLVEHLRIAQRDILDFVWDPDHASPDWPDGYWPDDEASPERFERSRQAFMDDLETVAALVEDEEHDLLAELDHAPGYTLLRQALLVADHNAQHLGEIIALRRVLGIWEPVT